MISFYFEEPYSDTASLEYSIMIRFKFLVRTWGHRCMILFDGSRNVLWPLVFLLVIYMSVDYKYIKFLWVKVYVLAKIILDRSKKRWKLPFFVDNFLKPWKSSPKNIICNKACKLPFCRVKLHHMDRKKMDVNLPYPNIFTRKKNYTFFFCFWEFFLKKSIFRHFFQFQF